MAYCFAETNIKVYSNFGVQITWNTHSQMILWYEMEISVDVLSRDAATMRSLITFVCIFAFLHYTNGFTIEWINKIIAESNSLMSKAPE